MLLSVSDEHRALLCVLDMYVFYAFIDLSYSIAQPRCAGCRAKLATRPADQKPPSGAQEQNRLLKTVGDGAPPERFKQFLAHLV